MTDAILRATAELNDQRKYMSEIFTALAKAQKNFEAARKSSENPHFKSKYAGLDACMDAVRGPCNDQGIFVTQTIESVESGVLIETMFAHSSGEVYLGGKLFMPVAKHDAQGYGSAITYGRRYSLLTACGVAPEDDDGNTATAAAPAKIIHPATAGIGDDLPEAEKQSLRELALEVIAEVSAGNLDAAKGALSAAKLEHDQKTWLWRQLDSKTRTALSPEKKPNYMRA